MLNAFVIEKEKVVKEVIEEIKSQEDQNNHFKYEQLQPSDLITIIRSHQLKDLSPQIAPQMTQMAPRPMYGQPQPFFQNHHFMGTPPVVMNPQETNNMNLHNMNLQAFKQTLDRQNGTINSLEEVFLKIQREINKLVAVPSTPIEWKRGHVFIDRLHNQWTCRSDAVVFENHKTKINVISMDTVTNSNQMKIRSWVTSDADLLRGMNLIFTAKINQDHNFTTASNINLISHRCDFATTSQPGWR